MKQQVVIAEFVVFAIELLVVELVELFVNKLLRLRLAREARESVNLFNFMMNFLSATNLQNFFLLTSSFPSITSSKKEVNLSAHAPVDSPVPLR